jgi:hypothetical protein
MLDVLEFLLKEILLQRVVSYLDRVPASPLHFNTKSSNIIKSSRSSISTNLFRFRGAELKLLIDLFIWVKETIFLFQASISFEVTMVGHTLFIFCEIMLVNPKILNLQKRIQLQVLLYFAFKRTGTVTAMVIMLRYLLSVLLPP